MDAKLRRMLVGATVLDVRPMKPEELEREGWDPEMSSPPLCLVLKPMQMDTMVVVMPSRDEEGNETGVLFAHDAADGDGASYIVC